MSFARTMYMKWIRDEDLMLAFDILEDVKI